MKMKLLDTALIGILAGMSAAAAAQETSAPESAPVQASASAPQAAPAQLAAPTVAPIDCSGDTCSGDNGELVFRLRTRSYDQPVTTGTSKSSSSQALQPDRRVSIALDPPGRAVATGTFSVQLPGGGAI